MRKLNNFRLLGGAGLLLAAIFAVIWFSKSAGPAAGLPDDFTRLTWMAGDPATVDSGLELSNKITVSGWIESGTASTGKMQVIAAQWQLNESLDGFDAFDASGAVDLDATGFLGAIFDGRYVYFSPQHNTTDRHGKVLRYDTHSDFHQNHSWQAYDAGNTGGMVTKGYYGGAFDGRYIYFTPRFDGNKLHTRTLRYDTRRPFKDVESWSAFDVGLGISYQGAGYDGRYVYFAPGASNETGPSGLMLRYDTRSPFTMSRSWETFDADRNFPDLDVSDFDGVAFDGTYIYYVPLSHGVPVRYDTRERFDNDGSWEVFNARPLGMEMGVGATFDGSYLYFVPYDNHIVVRYNTLKPFGERPSWSSFDVKDIAGLQAWGYDGAFFDGRFAWFIPFFHTDGQGRMNFHGELLRYDTTRDFENPASWITRDVSKTTGLKTVGYNAGIFDGRYFYFAPWHDGEAYHEDGRIVGHARVLRYDSAGAGATFILKYSDYGHNGGLSGAVPGPSFTVNTENGAHTVAAHTKLAPGTYHLQGVYDGKSIRLYINGEPAGRETASGRLIDNGAPVTVGDLPGGNALFNGRVERVEIHNSALPVSTGN